MGRIMKIGYIGNGKSANRYHIPYVLPRHDKMKVEMIYARHISHDKWKAVPGAVYTNRLEELLNNKELDVIVVNTPSSYHYTYAKKVLEAGKHCVVEKPFTHTAVEAAELFALAKEKGLVLEAYQNRRFDSDFLTLQKVLDSGKLGEVQEIESCYDYYRPEVPESIPSYSVEMSFLYGHCHAVDQVIALWGKPERVYCDSRQLLGEGRMHDYFDIDLYYGGVKVSVKSSFFRVKPRPSFVAYGTKGMFVKETEDRQEEHLKLFYMPGNPGFGMDQPQHYGTLTYYDENDVFHEEKVVSEQGDYGRFYDRLYDSVMVGAEPLVKPEETLALMEILEQGTKNF